MKTLTDLQKEAREIVSKAILDGQNQIHDLSSGRAEALEVNSRMFLSQEFHGKKVDDLLTSAFQAGIDAAIEALSEKERADFGRETSWEVEHANGFNKCLQESRTRIEALRNGL